MLKFKKKFMKMLNEDMMSASAFSGGNTVGQTGGGFGNVDSYAPGDARVPKSLGTVEVRRDKKKKKKKKKSNKNKSVKNKKIPAESFPYLQSRLSGMTGPGNNDGLGFM